MRAIPESMDTEVVDAIDRRLAGVESEHHVAIAWAIESGSRAWGFPSPDSDYDCRFIFVRNQADYLSLWPQRDVIETPLDEVFDVNGWDLAKAIRLALKGNAVVGEWLRSPIVYRGDSGFRSRLLELVDTVSNRTLIGRHYVHVCLNQIPDNVDDIALKTVFYALRAAAAVRWLRLNAGSIPPMQLSDLLDEAPVSRELRDEIDTLIERKAETREIGRGAFPPRLLAFVHGELDAGQRLFDDGSDHSTALRTVADDFFRSELDRWNETRASSLG